MTLVIVFFACVAFYMFARSKSQQIPVRKPQRQASVRVHIPSPGEFAYDIVGESHYQEALERICGGRDEEGAHEEVEALLTLENENPHDNMAVRVDIEGETVGYLSREVARYYRSKLKEAGQPNATARCDAIIAGGWDRGPDDRGYFGVKLDLPA
jgi:hypothetical protein